MRPAVLAAAATPYAVPEVNGPLRLLVVGGSQGARIMADVVPGAIERLEPALWGRLILTQQDLIAFHNPSYFPSAKAWEDYRQLTRLAMAAADRLASACRWTEWEITGSLAARTPARLCSASAARRRRDSRTASSIMAEIMRRLTS